MEDNYPTDSSQIASAYTEAFDALLDAYQQIGESLPLLAQYQALFERNPNMQKVLALIYSDILEFHKKALKYFRQRSKFVWEKKIMFLLIRLQLGDNFFKQPGKHFEQNSQGFWQTSNDMDASLKAKRT